MEPEHCECRARTLKAWSGGMSIIQGPAFCIRCFMYLRYTICITETSETKCSSLDMYGWNRFTDPTQPVRICKSVPLDQSLRPPAAPFEAILLYDRNQLKRHLIICFRLP